MTEERGLEIEIGFEGGVKERENKTGNSQKTWKTLF